MSAGPVQISKRQMSTEEKVDKVAAILEGEGLSYVDARRTAKCIVELLKIVDQHWQ